jgi:hypothetical protein
VIVDGDVAGYHCYPSRDRVFDWFNQAGLQVTDEGFKQEDGWGYRHFLPQILYPGKDRPQGKRDLLRH